MAKMANNPVRIQFVRHNFSEIQYKNLRFLITDRPTDANMDQYVAVGLFVYIFTRLYII